MRRMSLPLVISALLMFSVLSLAQAPVDNVKVKVRAALFDRDLNLKPVPRLVITFRNLDAPEPSPSLAQTNLDGVAELELKPARFKVTTDQAVELAGKAFQWDIEVSLLKPENLVELSNDNAKITDLTARGALVDPLTEPFKRVKDSVVTVWAEDYGSEGVVVNPAGLVLTSYALVEGHAWLAVQFDDAHKVLAQLVAHDKARDIAVLRVNLEHVQVGPLPQLTGDPNALVEGERVFTVAISRGGPSSWLAAHEERKLMSGTASKITGDTILSDAKLAGPGGPLFSSTGALVGLTTVTGRDLGIMPIAAAAGLLDAAKESLKTSPPPSGRLLPCHPVDYYPVEALKARGATRWEKEVYAFKLGDFEVELITPVHLYEERQVEYLSQVKERDKLMKKGKEASAVAEPKHQYAAVMSIEVIPQTGISWGKSFLASMATNGRGPTFRHYKATFAKLRLLCGDKEVDPVWPRRLPVSGGFGNYDRWEGRYRSVVDDDSFAGQYFFLPDAISPQCGEVTLEIVSGKDTKPAAKVLDPATVTRIWEDFDAYRKAQAKALPPATE